MSAKYAVGDNVTVRRAFRPATSARLILSGDNKASSRRSSANSRTRKSSLMAATASQRSHSIVCSFSKPTFGRIMKARPRIRRWLTFMKTGLSPQKERPNERA